MPGRVLDGTTGGYYNEKNKRRKGLWMKARLRKFWISLLCLFVGLGAYVPAAAHAASAIDKVLTPTSYTPVALMDVSFITAATSTPGCDLVGYGRMWLADPMFFRDHLVGRFEAKKCCLACSKCTELMRNKKVSGCAVFNEYYRNLYKEIQK